MIRTHTASHICSKSTN